MAHQTGITPSDELQKLIAEALNGRLRILQVHITNEQLVPGVQKEPNGTWEDDYDSFILPSLEDKSACYIFYRLDERNAHDNYLWIFLTFTPDEAPVREKMLYSATKATLKKAFSAAVVIHDISANSKDEMTLDGYRKHVESANAPPPLTQEEHDWKEIQEAEDHTDIGTTTRHSHLHGVNFPLHEDASAALKDLKDKKIQYVQLGINMSPEEIILEDAADTLEPNDIARHVSETKPSYHLYLYKHTHEGDYQESYVFIYSCPGYKCSVKERMVFSSCKSTVGFYVKEEGIQIAKSLEVDGPEELNEQYLMDELHPIKQVHKAKFARPKPPGRR